MDLRRFEGFCSSWVSSQIFTQISFRNASDQKLFVCKNAGLEIAQDISSGTSSFKSFPSPAPACSDPPMQVTAGQSTVCLGTLCFVMVVQGCRKL